VRRITDARNSFKHAHNWPGAQGIQQTREDAELFFQTNTPKVFDLSYDQIDMADLIVHGEAREKVKDASSAWNAGDSAEAMALLVDAFNLLFAGSPMSPRSRSPLAFGGDIRHPLHARQIGAVLWQPEHSKRRTVPTRGAEKLGEQLHAVTVAVDQMQTAMRMQAIGIDYRERYRFDVLAPRVSYTGDGTRHVDTLPGYAPASADFEFCKRFVVTVALRLAEVEAFATPQRS
jgi:hypothetical protein